MSWISKIIRENISDGRIDGDIEKKIFERIDKQISEWAIRNLDERIGDDNIRELKKKLLGGENAI